MAKFKTLTAAKRETLYAVRDITDGTGRVVTRAGQDQSFYPVDAVEAIRGGWWARERPAGIEPEERPNGDEGGLAKVLGIPRSAARLLEANGYASADDLREATPEELSRIKGIGGRMAQRIVDSALGLLRPAGAKPQAEAEETEES